MSSLNDAFFREQYNKYLRPLSKKEILKYSRSLNVVLGDEEATNDLINLMYNTVKTCNVYGNGCERCFETLKEVLETNDKFDKFNDPKVFTLVIYYFLLGRREFGIEEVIEVKKMGTNNVDESQNSVATWDEYFYNVAKQTARNSKCFSRKIGAVLVRDKSIVGTGYNGPPRGIDTCDTRWGADPSIGQAPTMYVVGKCPRQVLGKKSGEAIDLCPASHAEESAIVNSARMGICTKDTTMYLTCGIPCCKCAVKIINSGVSEIVVTSMKLYDELSGYLFKNSNIKIRLYSFLENKS